MEAYAGIDLHSTNSYIGIIDEQEQWKSGKGVTHIFTQALKKKLGQGRDDWGASWRERFASAWETERKSGSQGWMLLFLLKNIRTDSPVVQIRGLHRNPLMASNDQ